MQGRMATKNVLSEFWMFFHAKMTKEKLQNAAFKHTFGPQKRFRTS